MVGECGYYVDYGNEDEAYQAVLAALDDHHLGNLARERMVDCFPLKRRREQIAEVLEDAYGQRRGPLRRPVKEEVAARNV